MKQYLELIRDVLDNGVQKSDRTGTGTISVFGRQFRHDLSTGFPLLTTKKIRFKNIVVENLWFLMGTDKIDFLLENGCNIWNEWADSDNSLQRVYGCQWVDWITADGRHINQIAELIENLKKNPDSRRHLISAWNVGELASMALMPCHYAFQFYVQDNKLSCMFNMRSNDLALGNPFNTAGYALLTHMIAQQCDMEVGDIIYTGGDCHIYVNHVEGLREQLKRDPRPLPKLIIKRKPASIFDYKIEDFELEGYDPHAFIKFPVAV